MSTRLADGTHGLPERGEVGMSRAPVTAYYETAWGRGAVTVQDGRLAVVDLPGEADQVRVTAAAGLHPDDRVALARWTAELESYFRGERLGWSAAEIGLTELPVPEFARTVYASLLEVPAAATVSYGGLAELAGHPRAARAVGTAMASNPIPIVVPCHRVIRSDGRYGNYGNDPAYKVRLLEHERACVEKKAARGR